MSEWKKININELILHTLYDFKGHDTTDFTCRGTITMSSPNAPKKYRNKRKFYLQYKNGELHPDKDTWLDITHYRESEMIIPNEDQIKADNLANKESDEGEDTVNSFRAVYQFTGELDELSRNDLDDAIAALALDYGLGLVEL